MRFVAIAVLVVVAGFFLLREFVPGLQLPSSVRGDVHLAVREGDIDRLTALLASRADPNRRDDHGDTPLHAVISSARTQWSESEIVEILLQHGADPNALDEDGNTALMSALSVSTRSRRRALRSQTVQHLVAYGADVNAANDIGYRPLGRALIRGFESVVPILLDAGAEIGIIEAVLLGDSDKVAELIVASPGTVNEELENWTTPLMLAVYSCNLTIAELLLEHDAFVNAQDRSGFSPLHYALIYASSCADEMVALLIARGADPNIPSIRREETPLHYACTNGSAHSVRLLLGAGAEVDVRNRDGKTPLFFAAAGRSPRAVEIVGELIAAGADAKAKSLRGASALLLANNPGVVEQLLSNGADIHTRELLGGSFVERVTSRRFASSRIQAEVFGLLLEYGLDPNSLIDRRPVIFRAIRLNNPGMVQVLVDHGADLSVRDARGRTPLESADTPEIKGMLQAAAATSEVQD